VEDGGTGHKKLLVTRNNEESKEIYGGMQLLPMKQELSNSTSRETNAK